MTDPNPADVLERAAEIIEIGGLQRGFLGDMFHVDSPHCSMGAIALAGCELRLRDCHTTLALFDRYLIDHGLIGVNAVLARRGDVTILWNDGAWAQIGNQSAPTQAEVAEAMRQCAKELRNEADPS